MTSDTSGVSAVTKVSNKQVIFIIVPVIFLVIATLPGALSEEDKDDSDENETFSKSPTNHEKVLSRKKQTFSVNDEVQDYWVGSHKLEFKPHPLLMPSTQAPHAQIPIPLIEFGSPPTTTPSNVAKQDLPVAASEEQQKKLKLRNGKGRRKKSRNQRRLAHRTLWANASTNGAYLMGGLQSHPHLLQQQYYLRQQQQQQPVILTAAGVSPMSSSSLYFSPHATSNDDGFHGTATTWNINHPNNNLPNYATGQITSQDNQVVQNFHPASLQQLQFAYPQFAQTQQFIPQQFPLAHVAPSHQSLPISPSAPDTLADNIFMHSNQVPHHHAIPQQQMPSGSGGGNGSPVIVYVPSGMPQSVPQSSASGPSPMKTYSHFGPNEIPVDFNHNKQPYPTSGPGPTTATGHTNGKTAINPQYFRNNFIRMFMDKLANVGKVLPIPFVTKYTSSQNVQQGYNNRQNHGQFSRRM